MFFFIELTVTVGSVFVQKLLYCYVLQYLQIVMLSFLLSLKVQSSQSTQILLTNSLVHCCSSADTLSVVVSCVSPPISFSLHISKDHVLNRDW